MIHTYKEPQNQLVEDFELLSNFGSADDSAKLGITQLGKQVRLLKKKRKDLEPSKIGDNCRHSLRRIEQRK